METVAVQKNHKLILNNRKAGLVTGVLDVLSFNLNEILLETEQGMLMVRGTEVRKNKHGESVKKFMIFQTICSLEKVC